MLETWCTTPLPFPWEMADLSNHHTSSGLSKVCLQGAEALWPLSSTPSHPIPGNKKHCDFLKTAINNRSRFTWIVHYILPKILKAGTYLYYAPVCQWFEIALPAKSKLKISALFAWGISILNCPAWGPVSRILVIAKWPRLRLRSQGTGNGHQFPKIQV